MQIQMTLILWGLMNCTALFQIQVKGCVFHMLALPWQTPYKCQQTQAVHELEDSSTKSELGHFLSFGYLDVVLRDVV